MIRHIVMFSFKDEYEGESKAEMISAAKRKLERLKDSVESVVSLEVGLNCVPGNSYDLVLCADFNDLEGLDQYQNHPAHQEFIPFIGKRRLERACVDYEY